MNAKNDPALRALLERQMHEHLTKIFVKHGQFRGFTGLVLDAAADEAAAVAINDLGYALVDEYVEHGIHVMYALLEE